MASWAELGRAAFAVATWVPLGIAFNDLVASVHPVEGESMQPTLNAGGTKEWILLNRLATPQRGDPVVVADPGRYGELITKRIVGVAGDWVTFPQRSGDGTSSGKRASIYLYPGLWGDGRGSI